MCMYSLYVPNRDYALAYALKSYANARAKRITRSELCAASLTQ
jgi:hypothetical protein